MTAIASAKEFDEIIAKKEISVIVCYKESNDAVDNLVKDLPSKIKEGTLYKVDVSSMDDVASKVKADSYPAVVVYNDGAQKKIVTGSDANDIGKQLTECCSSCS